MESYSRVSSNHWGACWTGCWLIPYQVEGCEFGLMQNMKRGRASFLSSKMLNRVLFDNPKSGDHGNRQGVCGSAQSVNCALILDPGSHKCIAGCPCSTRSTLGAHDNLTSHYSTMGRFALGARNWV